MPWYSGHTRFLYCVALGDALRARVYRSSKREFFCRLSDGEFVYATALAKVLKGDKVVVGDYVELSLLGEGQWQIDKVLPRESEIFRISIREQRKRVTAANCDLMVIQSSVSRPSFKQGIVDRFLVRACQWEIRPIVIFNKMDEYTGDDFDITFEAKRLERLGAKCFEVCAVQGLHYKPAYLDLGWRELKEEMCHKTAIFLGQSGVGKSKMISGLSGGQVELKTNVVGKVGKGSHTTTWSEIVEFENFSIIDSPGIRSFSLEDIDPEQLLMFFPDLEELAVHCKFNNCTHEENIKGCAFYSSDLGEDTEYIHSRLESYKRIYDEVSQVPQWQKKI